MDPWPQEAGCCANQGSGIPSESSKAERGLPVLKFARHAEGCRAQGAKSPHPSMLADFLTADINLSLQKGRLPLPDDLGENFPRAQSASHFIFITASTGN